MIFMQDFKITLKIDFNLKVLTARALMSKTKIKESQITRGYLNFKAA